MGREGREEKFVKSLDAPLLATAIVDSLGVRYNDLAFRILEHWAKVLEACIHEQPSSLHQRHMMKLQDLASRLHGYATKLVESQRKLTGGGGGGDRAAGGKLDFFDVFTRRAEHLHARADRLLGQVGVLQDLYKTKLDEDRNWMVTALSAWKVCCVCVVCVVVLFLPASSTFLSLLNPTSHLHTHFTPLQLFSLLVPGL